METIIERKNTVSVYFNSILDLMDYAPVRNHNSFYFYMNKSREGLGPTDNNAKSVMNHALLGDDVLYEKHLKDKVIELDKATGYYTTDYKQEIKAVKRKVKYTDFGDEIDIHKVYRGEIGTAWRKTERIEVDAKLHLVTLLIDIGGTHDWEVTDSLWRAAIAIKLVRDLEAAGKTVKIVIGAIAHNVTKSNKIVGTSVVVKDYNQSLPLERLAAMCNLSFHRTATFAMRNCVEEKISSGLGASFDMTHRSMPWQLKDEEDAGHTKFVIIGRASSKRNAVSYLKNCYKQMKEFAGE